MGAGDERPARAQARPDPVIPGSARAQEMVLRARIAALRFAGDWQEPGVHILTEGDVYEIADRAYDRLTAGLTLLSPGADG